jgi:hypothetical protein
MSSFGRPAATATLVPVLFTGPGDFTFAGSNMVIVKKTVAAPTTVYMIANPITNGQYIIKDGKGDAGVNPITIDGNGKSIEDEPTYVLKVSRGSVTLFYDGTDFHVISEANVIGVQP